MEKRFKELGEGVVAEVRFVDSIDRTAAGKFRPVISLCAPRIVEGANGQ